MGSLYADIIVNIINDSLDKTFQYRIPEELSGEASVGAYVMIPFGKGNKLIGGYILAISDKPKIEEEKIKQIDSVVLDNELAEGRLIRLAEFIRNRYGSTMIQALKTVFPVKKRTKNKEMTSLKLVISENEAKELLNEFEKKHRTARARLLGALLENGTLDKRLVTGKLNISSSAIKAMLEQGIVKEESERVYRNFKTDIRPSEGVSLNSEQAGIASAIINDYKKGKRDICLIRGVTGSGKTEIYMEIISEVVKSGRQVIVLIPEIALTFQTLMRFYRRFGDRVSTLHSKLSEGERYDQFERARKGEISIMIGPRSALFTPFSDVGLIVIDEEHENSYKSEKSPKYHARDVAAELCRLSGATLILGSATPSVESYFEAEQGRYKLYTIEKRAKDGAALAETEVVDLREEFKAGNRSVFSRSLKEGIEQRLERNEQIMLFLNRRGYSGFISCRSCGHVVKCPHCDVALSRHANGKLVCHYCGYETADIKNCPECGSAYISAMKAGTEQIEEYTKKLFPYVKTLRMDADTTRKKDDYEKILSQFANREADILIGTQMIVKGHDFPYVTLVGILAADMSLFVNDYRASERTFQLLTQAAGRAGRDRLNGKVVIQTYNPEHYSIVSASKQDYNMFYNEEIAFRKLLDYPPAGHLLVVFVEAGREETAVSYTDHLAEMVNDAIINRYGGIKVRRIGPADASIKKLNDIYRRVMYVKCPDLSVLTAIKDELFFYDRERKNESKGKWAGARLSFDLDPMSGY
ncbi:MAG: primosomal protein N' [Lachnospiraceae bacterium]|nr:primosomal protein N' [Lachnospiraceae bacterium]